MREKIQFDDLKDIFILDTFIFASPFYNIFEGKFEREYDDCQSVEFITFAEMFTEVISSVAAIRTFNSQERS